MIYIEICVIICFVKGKYIMDTIKTEINEKHLEFIQNTITKMSRNSFQAKAWSITVLSVILVFYISQTENTNFNLYFALLIGVTVLFCLIDMYYTYLESGYRCLYNSIIKGKIRKYQYSMKIPFKKQGIEQFFKTFISIHIGIFYGSIFIGLIIIKYLIQN